MYSDWSYINLLGKAPIAFGTQPNHPLFSAFQENQSSTKRPYSPLEDIISLAKLVVTPRAAWNTFDVEPTDGSSDTCGFFDEEAHSPSDSPPSDVSLLLRN